MQSHQMINNSNNEATNRQGCKINDKNCIIESLFSKIPERTLMEYYDVLISEKVRSVLDDPDLCKCINSFFDNNLNVADTAKKNFVHRNTLLYRLKKIDKITGFDIKNFEDAVNFKIITLIYGALK